MQNKRNIYCEFVDGGSQTLGNMTWFLNVITNITSTGLCFCFFDKAIPWKSERELSSFFRSSLTPQKARGEDTEKVLYFIGL